MTWAVERARPLDPERTWAEVTVVLTDEAGMAEAHLACFGKASSTDVISQAYAPMPPEARPSGEIVVNVDRAVREGPRFGGASRELARYVAHGCQHLAGATDEDKTDRARMHRRERSWLAEADALHLLDELLEAGEKRPHQ